HVPRAVFKEGGDRVVAYACVWERIMLDATVRQNPVEGAVARADPHHARVVFVDGRDGPGARTAPRTCAEFDATEADAAVGQHFEAVDALVGAAPDDARGVLRQRVEGQRLCAGIV